MGDVHRDVTTCTQNLAKGLIIWITIGRASKAPVTEGLMHCMAFRLEVGMGHLSQDGLTGHCSEIYCICLNTNISGHIVKSAHEGQARPICRAVVTDRQILIVLIGGQPSMRDLKRGIAKQVVSYLAEHAKFPATEMLHSQSKCSQRHLVHL